MIPSHSALLIFVTSAAILLAIPEPAVLYITSRSVGQGRIAGIVSAFGIAVGTLVHATAAALGLSALLVSSTTAFSAVKYLGAAYLIYLGIQKLRREDPAALPSGALRAKLRSVFFQGIVVNVLNPKTALFFAALLPQFINPGALPLAQSLILGSVFVCIAMCTDSIYVLTAATLGARLRQADASQPGIGEDSWHLKQVSQPVDAGEPLPEFLCDPAGEGRGTLHGDLLAKDRARRQFEAVPGAGQRAAG